MSNGKTGRLDWLMLLYHQEDTYVKAIAIDLILKEFGIKDPSTLVHKNGWVRPRTLDEILGLE